MPNDEPVVILAFASSTRKRAALALGVIVGAGGLVAGGLAAAGSLNSRQGAPRLSFETQGAASAMASAFDSPSPVAVPDAVASEADALVSGGPVDSSDSLGQVLTGQGLALLSGLGPDSTTIYAFPTSTGGVCYVVTGIARGCKQAFPVDEPATIDADTLYPASQSGPISEMAGLAEDDVTGVKVIVNGVAHSASFGNDAWYYSFPDSMTPPSAVSALLVSLKDGSSVSVPTGFIDPPASS